MDKVGTYDGFQVDSVVPGDIADAIDCVTKIFSDALKTKHRSGDWRLLGWEGNFEAFSEHIAQFVKNSDIASELDEDHLANAACRLLLLLQLREEALAARKERRTPKA